MSPFFQWTTLGVILSSLYQPCTTIERNGLMLQIVITKSTWDGLPALENDHKTRRSDKRSIIRQ
jgi:hypothetical protein